MAYIFVVDEASIRLPHHNDENSQIGGIKARKIMRLTKFANPRDFIDNPLDQRIQPCHRYCYRDASQLDCSEKTLCEFEDSSGASDSGHSNKVTTWKGPRRGGLGTRSRLSAETSVPYNLITSFLSY